ncbi:MAG: hypothetical protein E2O35_00985 [Proteobacteria bacterium]|nr:MAG: hypothetical protein E2O35_00985 [Pseudomonadota bacterium]
MINPRTNHYLAAKRDDNAVITRDQAQSHNAEAGEMYEELTMGFAIDGNLPAVNRVVYTGALDIGGDPGVRLCP